MYTVKIPPTIVRIDDMYPYPIYRQIIEQIYKIYVITFVLILFVIIISYGLINVP